MPVARRKRARGQLASARGGDASPGYVPVRGSAVYTRVMYP